MTEGQLVTNDAFVHFMFQLWYATGREGKFSKYISDEIRTIVAATENYLAHSGGYSGAAPA